MPQIITYEVDISHEAVSPKYGALVYFIFPGLASFGWFCRLKNGFPCRHGFVNLILPQFYK
jgi:hypothetical protein